MILIQRKGNVIICNMNRFAILLFVVLLTGCSYDYFSKREKRKVNSIRNSVVVQNQLGQLRSMDSLLFTEGRTVIIHPLMCNKSGTGVYSYNISMIHFGYVHYFVYRNDSVIRIPRDNEDSLCQTVRQFLVENEFGRREIKIAIKKLKLTYVINITDTF